MLMENGEYSDERFIDAMVPHHQGAIEMAQVALEDAEHPEILALIPPGRRGVVAVRGGRVPKGVPNAVDTLLAQHFQKAGDARPFHLFEGL
jgi:Domain of unknown function (DUF305)